MHLKRLITALVLLPLLILLILKGGALLFSTLIAVVSLIALREFFRILMGEDRCGPVTACAFAIAPAIVFAAYCDMPQLMLLLVALSTLAAGVLSLSRYGEDPNVMASVPKAVLGIVYIPLFLAHLVFLRGGSGSPDGVAWIFLLLLLVGAGDTGAFYTGTLLGKRKLCPAISPGKTVEGFAGGLAAAVLSGIAYKLMFLPLLPMGKAILLFIAVGIAGPLGDLFESALKREGRIKDSGSLLPGHGGMLDRIDALLFAAPVAWLFKAYIV